MRKDGIPYVPNGVYNPPVAKPLEEMDLQDLVKGHLRTCAKSNGALSVCRTCSSKCIYGQRALDLYEGRVSVGSETIRPEETILYRMRKAQEEMRKAQEEAMQKKETVFIKPGKIIIDDWYEKATQSEDPVKWVMDTFNISKTKAKNKIYQYKYRMKKKNSEEKKEEVEEEKHEEIKTDVEEKKEEVKKAPVSEERTEEKKEEKKESNDIVYKTMEEKIDRMMKRQAEYKELMNKYAGLYKEVSEQIDVLCKALDVFDRY